MKINSNSTSLNRRQFLAGTSAAAAGLTFLKPSFAFGDEASRKLDLGLIGCGGRGQWIAKLFADSGQFNFVAVADYFPEKVKEFAGLSLSKIGDLGVPLLDMKKEEEAAK